MNFTLQVTDSNSAARFHAALSVFTPSKVFTEQFCIFTVPFDFHGQTVFLRPYDPFGLRPLFLRSMSLLGPLIREKLGRCVRRSMLDLITGVPKLPSERMHCPFAGRAHYVSCIEQRAKTLVKMHLGWSRLWASPPQLRGALLRGDPLPTFRGVLVQLGDTPHRPRPSQRSRRR